MGRHCVTEIYTSHPTGQLRPYKCMTVVLHVQRKEVTAPRQDATDVLNAENYKLIITLCFCFFLYKECVDCLVIKRKNSNYVVLIINILNWMDLRSMSLKSVFVQVCATESAFQTDCYIMNIPNFHNACNSEIWAHLLLYVSSGWYEEYTLCLYHNYAGTKVEIVPDLHSFYVSRSCLQSYPEQILRKKFPFRLTAWFQ